MKQIMTAMLFVGMMSSMMAQKGQDRKEMREKIEAEKVAFVTERAGLTPDESKVVWAIDGKMHSEMKEVKKESRSLKKLEVDKMSEEDAQAYLQKDMEMDQRILDIKKKYGQEMVKAVGAKKYIAMLQAERDFKKEVLRDYRKDRRKGMQRGQKEGEPMKKAPAPAK